MLIVIALSTFGGESGCWTGSTAWPASAPSGPAIGPNRRIEERSWMVH